MVVGRLGPAGIAASVRGGSLCHASMVGAWAMGHGRSWMGRRLRRVLDANRGLGERGRREQRLAHVAAVRRLTGASDVPSAAVTGPHRAGRERKLNSARTCVGRSRRRRISCARRGWGGRDFQRCRSGSSSRSGRTRCGSTSPRGCPLLRPARACCSSPRRPGTARRKLALHAASVRARASGASGFYFALPTMATADAMFERVLRSAEHRVVSSSGRRCGWSVEASTRRPCARSCRRR